MDTLNTAERELVALGAALGSNCVGCIEHHLPLARKAGFSDGQIRDALRLADQIRQVPARKVMAAALALCAREEAGGSAPEQAAGCGAAEVPGQAAQSCCG